MATKTTQHTPGPWIYDGDNADGRIGIYSEGAEGFPMICDTWGLRHYGNLHDKGAHSIDEAEEEANAARIVACVNACEGINPEAIRGLQKAIKRISDSITLVAANHKLGKDKDVNDIVNTCKTALAKAKGETP